MRGEVLVEMLGRQHDLRHLDRLAVLVANGDLALGVRAELAPRLAAATRLREALQDAVGVEDRRRHQLRRLGAGIAEHDALVAGTLVLVAGRIDADGDVGRLGMQVDIDLGAFSQWKPLCSIADVLDRQPAPT